MFKYVISLAFVGCVCECVYSLIEKGGSSVNCDRKARSDLPHGDVGKRLGHVKTVDWKFGVGKVKDHVSIDVLVGSRMIGLNESIGGAVSGERCDWCRLFLMV